MTRKKNKEGVPSTSADAKNLTEATQAQLEGNILKALQGKSTRQGHFARAIMAKLQHPPLAIEQPDQVQAVPPTVTFEELLEMCEPSEIGTWDDIMDDGQDWTKVAEGTYGDVYSASLADEERIIKIIPFFNPAEESGPRRLFNAKERQAMMSANDLASELATAKALNSLRTMDPAQLNDDKSFGCPNFVRLISARVVRGSYPTALLMDFRRFKTANKQKAENPTPTRYQPKRGAQLYLVQMLENGGKELEEWLVPEGTPNRTQKRMQRLQAGSIFFQLALSLAAAEEKMAFEHRDMHLSNILISEVEESYVSYCINGVLAKLKTLGVRATIIDYTHSRIHTGGRLFYSNMGQLDLFGGQGSQNQVYTDMRASNGDDWAKFTPRSNVLWLSYLATKLFADFREMREFVVQELATAERIKSFLGRPMTQAILYRYLYG